MAKISKELIEFKKLLEDDEFETYGNEEIEELNLDFLIDYIYMIKSFFSMILDTKDIHYIL